MKGKMKLKGLCVLLVLCVLLTLPFSVSSFAAESAENLEYVENEPLATDGSKQNVGSVYQPLSETDGNVGNSSNNKNVFETVYEYISDYAAEIISALTFIGTLIIGLAYKRGLIPLLCKATGNMQNAVIKIHEDTELGAKNTKETLECVGERISCMESSLAQATESIDRLEEKLESEEKEAKRRKMMDTVMRSQVDMLYDIFMTSSLPQYQKDAVGIRIQSMREELANYEKQAE